MESKRQRKFAGVLKEELAEIFQREGGSLLPNTLVTITSVRVSPDLGVAKIYLSFFNTKDTEASIDIVNSHNGEIRYKLGTRIRNQVRVIPELNFFVDDTNEYVERMDHLFDQLAKDKNEETKED